MAKEPREWEEVGEFIEMATLLVERFNNVFQHVDVDSIVAFKCTNKEQPEGKTKLYEMSGLTEPESIVCPKTYFIKMFHDVWEERDEAGQAAIVASCLARIDPEKPGKVLPFDLQDQNIMVRTFGIDWQNKQVPNLLRDNVDLKESENIQKSEPLIGSLD